MSEKKQTTLFCQSGGCSAKLGAGVLRHVLQKIPQAEELSGIGAAYMAGISAGLYSEEELFSGWEGSIFTPSMDVNVRRERLDGWKKAVAGVLDHT